MCDRSSRRSAEAEGAHKVRHEVDASITRLRGEGARRISARSFAAKDRLSLREHRGDSLGEVGRRQER